MKKILIVAFSVLLCFGAALGFSACKDEDENSNKVKVDINIAAMSATMAYTTLLQIEENPSEYEGKTIKVKGRFAQKPFSGGSKINHCFIYVYDSSVCCSARTTFIWDGSLPESGEYATVTGTVYTKKENGNVFPEIQAVSVKF